MTPRPTRSEIAAAIEVHVTHDVGRGDFACDCGVRSDNYFGRLAIEPEQHLADVMLALFSGDPSRTPPTAPEDATWTAHPHKGVYRTALTSPDGLIYAVDLSAEHQTKTLARKAAAAKNRARRLTPASDPDHSSRKDHDRGHHSPQRRSTPA